MFNKDEIKHMFGVLVDKAVLDAQAKGYENDSFAQYAINVRYSPGDKFHFDNDYLFSILYTEPRKNTVRIRRPRKQ